jgi:mRNA-degrading endonuclease toxin of MazEF toxin-antitoxin module
VRRREIWLVALDPTAGHEQRGTRPVLIVSPDAFNAAIGTPVVVPITTGGAFARNRGFAVSLVGTGLKTTGIVRCDQVRSLDLSARSARYLESVPEEIMDEVLARLAPIFS